jgi:hypothetical protein
MELLSKPGRAKDGHWCDSLKEIRIDDALAERGIPHEREPSYPGLMGWWRPYRADWRILCCSKVILVEYWGLVNIDDPDLCEEYCEKMARKKAIAMKEDIELVEIYPDDLTNEARLGQVIDRITELLERYPPDELLESLKSLERDCERLSKGIKVRGRPIGTRSYLVRCRNPRLRVEGLKKEIALNSIKARLEEEYKKILRRKLNEIQAEICWKAKIIESRCEDLDRNINNLNIKLLLAEAPVITWRSPASWFRRLLWLFGLLVGSGYAPWDGD